MLTIATSDEMFEFGKHIGSQLKAGDLILVNGPLGAGKTLLTQGIGAALGISGITSPTFVISRVHKGKIPLIHVDAYRLMQSDDPSFSLDDLDLDSERESAITVIEWGGTLAARLSDERLEITIDRTMDKRVVSAVTHGTRWDEFSL
ncbi:MAG: tRNA (adenosine(37)-N6)-threonylcarbamoyltransferase complex ATPase subunit type 1 TsaE [Actinomycetota bacterium]